VVIFKQTRLEKITIYFLLLGSICGVIAYLITWIPQILVYSSATLVGIFMYLVADILSKVDHTFGGTNIDRKIYNKFILISLILLWLALGLTLVIFRENMYFHIIIILIIFISLIYSEYYFPRVLSVLVAIAIFITLKYYSTAGFLGFDVWCHLKSSKLISDYGNTEVLKGLKEYYFPVLHIWIATVKDILNINIKDAGYLGVVLPIIVVPFMMVYVFLKNTTGSSKISLIGASIYSISDMKVFWSYSPQTTSFGAFLYIFLIYFYYKSTTRNNLIYYSFMYFYILLINISHPTSAGIISLLLAGSIISEKILFKGPRKRTQEKIFIVALVVFLAYNTVIAKKHGLNTFPMAVRSFLTLLDMRSEFIQMYVSHKSSIANIYILTGNIGMYILLIFVFIVLVGKIQEKDHQPIDWIKYHLLGGIVIAAVYGYILSLVGLTKYFVGRIFVYLFLLVSLAFGTVFNNRKITIIVYLLILIVITSSIISPNSNYDNPPFLKTYFKKESISSPELYGTQTLIYLTGEDRVFSDYFFSKTAIYWWVRTKYAIAGWSDEYIKPFSDVSKSYYRDKLFIWRNTYLNRPYYVMISPGEKVLKSPLDKNEYLRAVMNISRIYSNPDIEGWLYS